MLIRDILFDHKEQRKPKGAKFAPKPVSTEKPTVSVFFASTFYPAFKNNVEKHAFRKALTENLGRFIKFKRDNPFALYPGVDRTSSTDDPFSDKNIFHAKVGLDHRLFYTVFRKDSTVYILLFGVYTHDNSGIGTRPNRNLQNSLANAFEAAKLNTSTYKEFNGQL